jgi:uncharacterized protein involved in exopolysaccharide biosynthesis
MSEELARSHPPVVPILHARPAPMPDGYRSLSITLLKWKWLILGLGLSLALSAAVMLRLQPTVWSATAKILLKTDRLPLQVSGLGFIGKSGRGSSEDLTTEVEFLESAVVLLPVARALRMAEGDTGVVPDSALQGAVDRLRARIVVAAVPNTSVIQTTYSADSRAEAESTLGLILDHYVEQHAVAYSGGARLTTFYEHELQKTAENLRQAEDRLRAWQTANNIVSIEGQITAQLALVSATESNLKRTEVEIGGTRAAIAGLTADMAAQPERSVASRQHGSNPMIAKIKSDLASAETALDDAPQSPLIARLKGDLVTVQLALNDLRQRYHDADRRVEEKKVQIAMLEAEIATAERDAAKLAHERVAALRGQLADAERAGNVLLSEIVATNPVRDSLARELSGTRSRMTALLSQADALRVQLQDGANALTAVRAKQSDFERLSRDVDAAKALYLANSKRLDDSRIVARLEKEELSTVAVIERPRATGGRSTTRQLTLVTMAGMVGLGLGAAAAFAAELLSGTLRTPQEAEFHLGIPVVATVPALPEARRARELSADGQNSSPPPKRIGHRWRA